MSYSTTQRLSARNEIEGDQVDRRWLNNLVICSELLQRATERSGDTEGRRRVVSRAGQ